jgi:hypothetical protein
LGEESIPGPSKGSPRNFLHGARPAACRSTFLSRQFKGLRCIIKHAASNSQRPSLCPFQHDHPPRRIRGSRCSRVTARSSHFESAQRPSFHLRRARPVVPLEWNRPPIGAPETATRRALAPSGHPLAEASLPRAGLAPLDYYSASAKHREHARFCRVATDSCRPAVGGPFIFTELSVAQNRANNQN